jgi:hypothetical protein
VGPVVVLLGLLGPLAPVPAAPPAAVVTPRVLDIEGNLVLVDEVYLAALDLPATTEATEAAASDVERQLTAFLRRAGYALATVRARLAGGRIRVDIDEGRLSRIAIHGRDVVASLAVRLQIDLPYGVFNRPQLERLLQRFREDGAQVTWQLMPARVVNHLGPQVDPLAMLPGGRPLPASSNYELHIEFTGGAERGFTLVAGIDPDSIRAGGVLIGSDAVLDGDRWELEAQVGANFFEDLERQADELHFSRAFTDARWLAPSIAADVLRPTVRLREDILRRQRQDLDIQTYWWNVAEGAVGLSLVPWEGIELNGEIGAQHRRLFAIDQLEDSSAAPIEPASALRPFFALDSRFVLTPELLRVDRTHRIDVDARYFPGFSRRPFWSFEFQYRRVFEFGWNDLWLRGAAGAVAGNYEITDATPMTGRYLRGVFGHAFYLDRAAALALEYRLSLSRDVFKVGFFHEAAVFREADPPVPDDELVVGNSFGPSFHALVMDVLQLDFFYAAGFTTDGDFDHGVSLRLEKAF